jgi:hypothetical protein
MHGWAHHMEIANTRIFANHGTLSGGINVGNGETPPMYINDGTICGNGVANPAPLSPPVPQGTVVNGRIANNWVLYNQSVNPTLPTNGRAAGGRDVGFFGVGRRGQGRANGGRHHEESNGTCHRAKKVSPYQPVKLTAAAQNYYMASWGIDKLKVSYTASGNLIRFSYRVAEPKLAAPLGDEKAAPSLLGQRSHAMLQVPLMDKVGNLRQTGVPKAGQEYWMVFSNKGDFVKRGDRVNVTIGNFHADGLVVE